MQTLVQGVHHITLCPGGAQEDLDFFTQVLGQRLVKQTVLMDGSIPIYHLYYGNADADVGSIATTFPVRAQAGSRRIRPAVRHQLYGADRGDRRSGRRTSTRTGSSTAASRSGSARSTCACAIRPGCSSR